MEDKTINYYDNNAHKFVSDTLNCEFNEMQDMFLNLIKPGSKILDLGCGSGRDSKYFKDKGYNVVPLDGSKELCQLTKELIGQEVIFKDFRDLDYYQEFDGIWACASLLHLKKSEIKEVIKKCLNALKLDGILYCSFKYGLFEGDRNGRYFTDLTEEEFRNIVTKISNINIIKIFISNDVRKGRKDERWLNIFIKK